MTACEASTHLTADSTGAGSFGALLVALSALAFSLFSVRLPRAESSTPSPFAGNYHLRFRHFWRAPTLSVRLQVFRL